MFKVEVIGNLGADVEIKNNNGSQFAAFRVANSTKYKTQDGREVENTDWIDCSLNNVESKVLPYLKAGVKVFVRGNGSLRVYSSKKDRMMKAGLQVSVSEVELCGGSSELVPRQLVDPDNGSLIDTQKFYWCNAPTKGMKKDDIKLLVDTKGNKYLMNHQGFVAPEVQQGEEQTEEIKEASKEETK